MSNKQYSNQNYGYNDQGEYNSNQYDGYNSNQNRDCSNQEGRDSSRNRGYNSNQNLSSNHQGDYNSSQNYHDNYNQNNGHGNSQNGSYNNGQNDNYNNNNRSGYTLNQDNGPNNQRGYNSNQNDSFNNNQRGFNSNQNSGYNENRGRNDSNHYNDHNDQRGYNPNQGNNFNTQRGNNFDQKNNHSNYQGNYKFIQNSGYNNNQGRHNSNHDSDDSNQRSHNTNQNGSYNSNNQKHNSDSFRPGADHMPNQKGVNDYSKADGNQSSNYQRNNQSYQNQRGNPIYDGNNENNDSNQPIMPSKQDNPYTPQNFRAHSGIFTGEVEGRVVNLSQCNGKKKAFLIGINYTNSESPLNGCHNDVDNVSALLQSKFGFKEENMTIMKDDPELPEELQPTRENMIAGLHLLVEGAEAGDSLFFHFSGHGGNQEDLDGDEDDGMDETICPVDYEEAGDIIDDELFEILVKDLPKGVRLTALFDSCHSGTALDLPFSYKSDGSLLVKEMTCTHRTFISDLNKAASSLLEQGDEEAATEMIMKSLKDLKLNKSKTEVELAQLKKNVVADVIMFSGCRDTQYSSDVTVKDKATGALSHALVKVIKENSDLSYLGLLNKVRLELEGEFDQFPQISSGYPMDLNAPFIM